MTTTQDNDVNVKKELTPGVDGELNWIGTDLPCTSKQTRNLYNPFITNKAVDAILKKSQTTSSQRFPQLDKNDNQKNIQFSLLLDKDDIFRRKLNKAEMYDYPLQDILLAPVENNSGDCSSRDRRSKYISEGTQTTLKIRLCSLEFVSIATQTEVNDCIINII